MSDQHTSKRIREVSNLDFQPQKLTVHSYCLCCDKVTQHPDGIRIHVEFIDMEWPL